MQWSRDCALASCWRCVAATRALKRWAMTAKTVVVLSRWFQSVAVLTRKSFQLVIGYENDLLIGLREQIALDYGVSFSSVEHVNASFSKFFWSVEDKWDVDIEVYRWMFWRDFQKYFLAHFPVTSIGFIYLLCAPPVVECGRKYWVSKLVFYAQSTIAVISGRTKLLGFPPRNEEEEEEASQ